MTQDDDGIKPRKRRPHEADPWYKRYARDFFEDTRELQLDERGAYNDIVDLIYMAGGPVRDDHTYIAHKLHCHANKWRAIRGRLLALGFLFKTGGKLHNKRCKEVLAERAAERAAHGNRNQGGNLGQTQGVTGGGLGGGYYGGLFENVIDINGHLRVNSTDSDSDQEKIEKKNTPRRPLPQDLVAQLVDLVGQKRTEELIEEYHRSGMAAGAKRLRYAFPAWLAKEQGIAMPKLASNSVGALTADMMAEICGRDDSGRAITTLPKTLAGRERK